MTHSNPDETEETPLDPAVARVQARLQKLMLVAGATLGLGIVAVFFAIIYRISSGDDKVPVASTAGPVEAVVPSLPAQSGASSEEIEAGSGPPGTGAATVAVKATIPADARLVASTVAGGRIVLTYDHFAGTIVIIVDPDTLQIVGRLDLRPE